MNFEWSPNDIAKEIVTVSNNTITLNTAACRHFENVQYVLLGLDSEKHLLGIKPVAKEQLDANYYPREQLHRISIGKSYGRITNKVFLEQVATVGNVDLGDNQVKYSAKFDVVHQILIINL
ncbi:hypothetical protein [Tannockella kyphosi]|uniref:hypothetical protein n=1 Tax=Tannockella kyphosi TaxID=2899121 RepID=UPI0020127AAF|nr:hypothetical protein [Tannockella kyphosi]